MRVAAAAVALVAAASNQASAIPAFAHRYGVPCQACHTIVPRLNRFGEAFLAAGFRWPAAVTTRPAFPVSAKGNLAYSSASDPNGLPKAIVDEVEFLVMGAAGTHLDYRFEQYAMDGGVPGKTRDAYVAYKSDPYAAWRGSARPLLEVQAGQFTLPLPNDPETQRPTENHYAVFDQTVGGNPFTFFDDRIGLNVELTVPGAALNVLALKGHDPQSGLPTSGTDTMAVLRVGTAPLALYGYQYAGTRSFGPVPDVFRRRALALKSITGKARTSLLVQTGSDSSADGLGVSASSSGGYLQEEWAFNGRLIGALRYDGTRSAEAGMLRTTTISLSYRPTQRSRFTIEDVVATQPVTSHTLNLAYLFAY